MSKALAVDDLEPGMFIVTTGLRGMNDDAGNPLQFPLDGRPILIKSISLPFALIEAKPGEYGILDTRRHCFSRVSPEYVQAVRSLIDKQPPQLNTQRPRRACPNCSRTLGVMLQRSADGEAATTTEFCPHCHWEGPNG